MTLDANLSADVAAEYRTLQDIVTDRLRSAILSGQLGPGDRLQHDDIARQFGVSRMPVREALRVLQSEGLIELRPHRGAVVVDLRPNDVAEIFEIRAMLEARAAELAAPNLTNTILDQMRQLLGEMERIGRRHQPTHPSNGAPETDGRDDDRWLTLNSQFHTIVYPASGWPHLCSLIEAQRNLVQPYHRLAAAYLGRIETAHPEHVTILEAAEARDGPRLAALTVAHMRRTASELIDYLTNRRRPASNDGAGASPR